MKLNENYITTITNWIMEANGDEPFYLLKAQFRDTNIGVMIYCTRVVYNKRHLKGEELQGYLQHRFDKFIEEKEACNYNFVPFEDAKYYYPATSMKRCSKSWTPITFKNQIQKEIHKFFLRLAQEDAIEQENYKYGFKNLNNKEI